MALADRKGALLGSALLHAAGAGAALIAWSEPDAAPVRPVPITLVTSAPTPTPELRPALEAETPEPAAVETPAPEAPPEPPAPTPAPAPEPTPAPPPPRPAPPKPAPPKPAPNAPKPAPAKSSKPQPGPTSAKPAPSKPAPAKPQQTASLDFDALASDIAKSRPSGAPKTSAPKGPTRPARAASSGAATASLMAGVVQRLNRNWNPNCGVEGADEVTVTIRIRLNPDGGLREEPRVVDGGDPRGSSLRDVATARALGAVRSSAPFSELPPDRYEEWRDPPPVRFIARSACAGR